MKITVDPRLAWLRKVSDDPSYYLNEPARLAYLEYCLAHDPISGDTREMLRKQIQELREKIEGESHAKQE